jgi:hypothetical protein
MENSMYIPELDLTEEFKTYLEKKKLKWILILEI